MARPTGRLSTDALAILTLVIQALITLALLGFAYLLRDTDRSLADVVVGIAATHWLKESSAAGRKIDRNGDGRVQVPTDTPSAVSVAVRPTEPPHGAP